MNIKAKPSAVVFARHLSKLVQFYREVVGMEEIHTDKAIEPGCESTGSTRLFEHQRLKGHPFGEML